MSRAFGVVKGDWLQRGDAKRGTWTDRTCVYIERGCGGNGGTVRAARQRDV